MKISYNWLKDYVDVKLDPEKLASLLTMAGCNVASYESIGGDYVFDFEITANRPDCLSVLGIARETAAILDKRLNVPKALRKAPRAKAEKPSFEAVLKDPELCFRYTARIIRNVEVVPSPEWLKDKIISVGLRPVNNIVDITNFVLLETGQPMHAFDFDKITGPMCVRRAKKGEQIIAIDNIPRVCDGDTLVIADDAGPIAIAGVMGGLSSEVGGMTKNILLESAFFNPISVRRTSRKLGATSESSYRFERRIDNGMVLKAQERAASLIEEIAGGKAGPILDLGKKTCYSKTINLDLEKTNSVLGLAIGKGPAAKILKALGFSVKGKADSLKVTVPSFREDVKKEIDLTEEIARIYGYEKIPLTVPRIVGNTCVKDFESILEDKVRETLERLGMDEIITYSLIKRNGIKDLGVPEDEVVPIKNPISIDQEILRPTMLPGMLKCLSYNINRKAKRLSFFEIGKNYKEKNGTYAEESVLSLALYGIKREDWKIQREDFSFFDLKGVFEKLLETLGLERVVFKKAANPVLDENISLIAEHKDEKIGCLGEVAANIRENFDIEKNVFYGELYIKKLQDKVKLGKKYAHLGRYPSIVRDMSVVLETSIAASEVTDLIKTLGETLVKKAFLVGSYKGKQIPEGKKGLLYRIEYRSDEKTLEDAEVDTSHSRIKSALSEKLNISFR